MYQNRDVSLIILANVLKYQLLNRSPWCSVTRAIKYDAFGIWSVSYRAVKCVLEMFSVGRCSSAKLMQIMCHRLNDAGSSAKQICFSSAVQQNNIRHSGKKSNNGFRLGQNKKQTKNENVIF